MALNGGFNTSPPYITSKGDNITFRFNFNVAQQSVSGNYSDIDWQLVLNRTSGHIYCGAFKVIVDGETFTRTDRLYMANGDIALSGTKRIYHNSDGSKKFNVFAEGAIYYNGVNTSGEETFILNTIPRQADLTSAPNFNDEQNPTIKYHNPVGAGVSSLQACIASSDGKIIYAPYRDVSKTSGSYTFNLTETERNNLRKACKNSKSITIEFALMTVIGSKTYYSVIYKTLSIINDTPKITNYSIYDTNQETIEITKDKNCFIKSKSNVYISFSAVGLKGATISHYFIYNGNSIYNNTSTITINNIQSGCFKLMAEDSRGNRVSVEINKTIYDYITPNIDISEAKISTNGLFSLKVNGVVRNGSYGSQKAYYNIYYKIWEKGTTEPSWINITSSMSFTDNYKYIASVSRSGFTYNKYYNIRVGIDDDFGFHPSTIQVITSKPVFDWGKDDFNFNVPVKINNKKIDSFVINQGSSGNWVWKEWSNGITDLDYRGGHQITPYGGPGADGYSDFFIDINLPFVLDSTGDYLSITASCKAGSGFGMIAGTWVIDRQKMRIFISSNYSESVWMEINLHVCVRW